METDFNLGVINLKDTYQKPAIVNDDSVRGVAPAIAAAAAAGFVAGFKFGLAKGRSVIDSGHTQSLPRRSQYRKVNV